MKRTLINTITLSSSILLVACGGGGGGSGNGATQDNNPPTSTSPTVLIGSIIDSPIQNFQFETSSNREGSTDNNGEFEFEENDTVVFSIGNIEFEAIDAKKGLTPLELFGTGNLGDRRVINFTRFIQTLDDDGDISLAITITESATSAVETSGLVLADFDSDPADFSASEKVQTLLAELNLSELVSIENANTHFSDSLKSSEVIDTDNDGIPNKSDPDDDNDGVEDQYDEHPYDELVSGDFDGDGIDNIDDADDDNDGTDDSVDDFPFDPSETKDSDGDLIGDNADIDDDNDGFNDDVDEFPLDPEKSGDADSDGIDNISDDDDDGDGTLDINDKFPLDSSETADFDGDGIGDNADTDDDNDNILDSEDRINITGHKSSYIQEEKISLKARGFDPNFDLATDADGWHIQFYTYSEDEPGRALTEYSDGGTYNANFDAFSGYWNIEYWAPRKPGNYRTEVILYCSASPSECETNFSYDQISQDIYFSSLCKDDPCSYEPLPARGNYVTNTRSYSYDPEFVQRSNGQLLAIHSDIDQNKTFTSISDDGGVNWSEISTLPARIYDIGSMIETSGGSLVFIANCSGATGFCLYSSADALTWSQQDITAKISASKCSTASCYENIETDSIQQIPGGGFAISYTHYLDEGDNPKYDIYVTYSDDLENWNTPVKVSSGLNWEYNSTLLASSSGSFYLSYLSYTDNSIVVAESSDLVNWEKKYVLGQATQNAASSTIMEVSGKPTVFYEIDKNLNYSHLTNSGSFSTPKFIIDGIPNGPRVKVLQSGNIGVMYEMDLNNQRDIFYEELDAVPVDN